MPLNIAEKGVHKASVRSETTVGHILLIISMHFYDNNSALRVNTATQKVLTLFMSYFLSKSINSHSKMTNQILDGKSSNKSDKSKPAVQSDSPRMSLLSKQLLFASNDRLGGFGSIPTSASKHQHVKVVTISLPSDTASRYQKRQITWKTGIL